MIENNGAGGFDVACDGCDQTKSFDDVDDDWSLLLHELGVRGWAWQQVLGDFRWDHFCPDCVQGVGGVDPYWKQKDALT